MAQQKKYKYLFFDLDKTLWDFDANSTATLRQLYTRHKLGKMGVYSFDDFHEAYKIINAELWEKYRNGEMDKPSLSLNRFHFTLLESGIDDVALATKLSEEYIDGVSEQTVLFPHVYETLDYLYGRYHMHVLTNGFSEVQYRKIETTGLGKYFEKIITAEEAGSHKPALKFFQYALEKTGADPGKSLMIGDDPAVDLIGAKSAGIDQMFVNYDGIEVSELFTFTIRSLQEIRLIL
jgi:putative hydrolase of the HAD superfamily